ncbi:MAG: dimethylsulfonioproprionate lyase family protein [Chloroflexota bacterium]
MTKIIPLEQGNRFQMGGGDSRHLVSPEIGAQGITMNYSIFQPGHEFPQHFHDVSADIFIVLEGGVSVRQGDEYTPIHQGDFAYIPPGEVHGTVNTTHAQAILISFQAPPDQSLYSGDRDPANTGVTPRPPEGHVTTVQIRQLTEEQPTNLAGIKSWHAASPETGTKEMHLNYYELEPNGEISRSATEGESIWFAWQGTATIASAGESWSIPNRGVAFVPPGEAVIVQNLGTETAQLIRCQAIVLP